MRSRRLLARAAPLAAAAIAVAAPSQLDSAADGGRRQRVYTMPEAKEPQRAASHAPNWDWNWDYRELTAKDVASQLGHAWPIDDYAKAIHKLFADHTDKKPESVDKLIEKSRDDLPALYRTAYRQHAFGGAKVRHILLVRHGQYEEQRELSRKLEAADEKQVQLEELTMRGPSFELVNARQVLTPLGRKQAALAGDRLAEMLQPALHPAREGDVRLHVSTLTRARQSAEIIASRLPSTVVQLPADFNLSEGCPPAHDMPTGWALDDGVHYEGVRIEAAFRRLFYRSLPRKADALAAALAQAAPTPEEVVLPAPPATSPPKPSKHEYEIVVCHMNVIRYFVLRALQVGQLGRSAGDRELGWRARLLPTRAALCLPAPCDRRCLSVHTPAGTCCRDLSTWPGRDSHYHVASCDLPGLHLSRRAAAASRVLAADGRLQWIHHAPTDQQRRAGLAGGLRGRGPPLAA